MNRKSASSILLLYEGETEVAFYDRLFHLLGISGNTQIKRICLHGNYNLNAKVANAIYNYLEKNSHINQLTVFVAIDRDGPIDTPTMLNSAAITAKIDDSRLKAIHEIVATQMLESWFFIDMDGIYKFLKAPKSKRNAKKYARYTNFNHADLDRLFRQFDPQKRYYKGTRVQNFIEHLDIIKIYQLCPDLNTGINMLLQTAGLRTDNTKK